VLAHRECPQWVVTSTGRLGPWPPAARSLYPPERLGDFATWSAPRSALRKTPATSDPLLSLARLASPLWLCSLPADRLAPPDRAATQTTFTPLRRFLPRLRRLRRVLHQIISLSLRTTPTGTLRSRWEIYLVRMWYRLETGGHGDSHRLNKRLIDHRAQIMSGLKVLAAAFLSAALPFASAVAVMAADDPPRPPKSAVPDGTSTGSASKPMIIQNLDGTFTVQKEPPKDAKGFNGLVIPPQVVVPEVPLPEKK
jgi:hypothetical protein